MGQSPARPRPAVPGLEAGVEPQKFNSPVPLHSIYNWLGLPLPATLGPLSCCGSGKRLPQLGDNTEVQSHVFGHCLGLCGRICSLAKIASSLGAITGHSLS